MNIIAIDCGASFIKSALFNDQNLVKVKQVAAPPVKREDDIFDTKKIETLINIVQSCINELAADIDDGVICIDNEMHGCILARPDGTSYTDYISWQKELIESEEVWAVLQNAMGDVEASEIIRHTGMPLRSGLPGSTLLWLRKNGYLNADERLHFYTLGDYIIRRITGKEPLCHPTNAAATGLYDIENECWNKEYISLLTGGNQIVFPAIGKKAIDFKIDDNKTFAVLPALGDQQAALLGSGLSEEDELSFNMGTGAQVSRLLNVLPEYGECQIRPYFYGKYLKTIPHVPCGRAINVIFRFLKDILSKVKEEIGDEEIWAIMQEAADSGSLYDSNLELDLSFFENAITDHTKGSISNVGEYELTFENLIKGMFYQMADNFVTVTNKVNSGLVDYNTIIFSGGIAKRWDILRDEIVDRLETGAEVILSENDTLYGCVKYALMDTGER